MGEKKLKWPALFKPIEGLSPGEHDLVCEKEIIPIIFVPGIMGSRLKQAKDGKRIWDPDDLKFMFLEYGLADAKEKKEKAIGERFDPDRLVPHDDDPKHNAKIDKKYTVPEWDPPSERGWGTVAFSFYEPVLARLQDPSSYGQAVRAAFDLPVHAFGYNWSASNATSGGKLKEYVGKLKSKYGCKQVIIVTHSMGGLVTAGALWIHDMWSDVVGVLHGVMPADGAGTLYWRMKGGLERTGFMSHLEAWVMGVNGQEVTAMVGNMPGGLQLLPNQRYRANNDEKWLQIADFHGVVKVFKPDSEPYDEIYKNKKDYWRAADPSWLNPGKDKAKDGMEKKPDDLSEGDDEGDDEEDPDWSEYAIHIDTAKSFHEEVKLDRKVPCEAFYGTGLVNGSPTTDRVMFKVEEHAFEKRGDTEVRGSLMGALSKVWSTIWGAGQWVGQQATAVSDWWHSRGGFVARITKGNVSIVVRLAGSDGTGDNTVAESSARVVKLVDAYDQSCPKATEFPGIDHGKAYKDDGVLKLTTEMVEKFCKGKIKKETGG